VQQTAACNAVHEIKARACKWLSRMHELSGPDLLLTQEERAYGRNRAVSHEMGLHPTPQALSLGKVT
jgi:hypothetical protein